jgi:cytochrome P450
VAIAEALRLEPPVIMLGRWVLRDVEMAGVLLPKGAELVMLWAAGNLDPDAFPDPERFDLSRRLQGATTFGGGAHICPGRHAAVMMTRVLLETITEEGLSFDRIENSERWLDRHLMCQLETLEVVPYRGN